LPGRLNYVLFLDDTDARSSRVPTLRTLTPDEPFFKGHHYPKLAHSLQPVVPQVAWPQKVWIPPRFSQAVDLTAPRFDLGLRRIEALADKLVTRS